MKPKTNKLQIKERAKRAGITVAGKSRLMVTRELQGKPGQGDAPASCLTVSSAVRNKVPLIRELCANGNELPGLTKVQAKYINLYIAADTDTFPKVLWNKTAFNTISMWVGNIDKYIVNYALNRSQKHYEMLLTVYLPDGVIMKLFDLDINEWPEHIAKISDANIKQQLLDYFNKTYMLVAAATVSEIVTANVFSGYINRATGAKVGKWVCINQYPGANNFVTFDKTGKLHGMVKYSMPDIVQSTYYHGIEIGPKYTTTFGNFKTIHTFTPKGVTIAVKKFLNERLWCIENYADGQIVSQTSYYPSGNIESMEYFTEDQGEYIIFYYDTPDGVKRSEGYKYYEKYDTWTYYTPGGIKYKEEIYPHMTTHPVIPHIKLYYSSGDLLYESDTIPPAIMYQMVGMPPDTAADFAEDQQTDDGDDDYYVYGKYG